MNSSRRQGGPQDRAFLREQHDHRGPVLPYDPDLDRVVLIEQFRPGAYASLTFIDFPSRGFLCEDKGRHGGDQAPWTIPRGFVKA